MNPATPNLFGEIEPPPGRYAEGTRTDREHDARPWTDQEDLALWAVWVSCNSDRAEMRAAEFLCDLLKREAELPGHPTRGQQALERLNLLRRRTYHSPQSILGGGRPNVLLLADWLNDNLRDKQPATWVEKNIWVHWNELRRSRKPRISDGALHRLLQRRMPAPELTSFQAPLETGDPCRPANAYALSSAILGFITASPNDEVQITRAWAQLHKALQA